MLLRRASGEQAFGAGCRRVRVLGHTAGPSRRLAAGGRQLELCVRGAWGWGSPGKIPEAGARELAEVWSWKQHCVSEYGAQDRTLPLSSRGHKMARAHVPTPAFLQKLLGRICFPGEGCVAQERPLDLSGFGRGPGRLAWGTL